MRPACMINRVRHRRTDLGANLLNFKKYMNGGFKFSRLTKNGEQDGAMIDRLTMMNNWAVKHITKYPCLFHHWPEPILCTEMGGIFRAGRGQCDFTTDQQEFNIVSGITFKCTEQ